jgi:hypothetical protein
MKIAVSGGRDYADARSVRDALTWAVETMRHRHGSQEPIVLIHGGATGADTLAQKWAEWWVGTRGEEVEVVIVEAGWTRYGKSAGPIRNSLMANLPGYGPPDLWVIFPGGRGTAHARSVAVQAGIQIMDVNPDDPSSQRPAEVSKPS